MRKLYETKCLEAQTLLLFYRLHCWTNQAGIGCGKSKELRIIGGMQPAKTGVKCELK